MNRCGGTHTHTHTHTLPVRLGISKPPFKLKPSICKGNLLNMFLWCSCNINICRHRIITVLGLYIWKKLHDNLEAKWSYQRLKKLQSDWFARNYKWEVSSYRDNTRVVLCSRLNLGFNLNYSRFLLQILFI